jgi:predicted permease
LIVLFRSFTRSFWREPAFALGSVAVLALGIGAATAIFTLLEKVVLQPLPFPRSDRLLWLYRSSPTDTSTLRDFTPPEYLQLQKQNTFFEKLAAIRPGLIAYEAAGDSELIWVANVTEDFFSTLGNPIEAGRVFYADEHRSGNNRHAILSYEFWQSHYGGNLSAIGKQIDLDGLICAIVGILPKDYPLDTEYQVLLPLVHESFKFLADSRSLRPFGRLRNSITVEQAQAEAQSIEPQIEEIEPSIRNWGFRFLPFPNKILGNLRQTLWSLGGAVGCLLLITCANLACLFLVRGARRSREMAIRAAVGAETRDLMLQGLGESTLVAVLGGMLGYPLASWGIRLLLLADPGVLPRAYQIRPDFWTVLFSIVLSLLTGLIFGALPAWRASRADVQTVLHEYSRASTTDRASGYFRSVLVTIEVALGVMLLAVALLFAQSFERLEQTPLGFETRNVITFEASLTGHRFSKPETQAEFFRSLAQRLEQAPGVRAVGSALELPLRGEVHIMGIWLDTQEEKSPQTILQTDTREITPGYFEAMGIPLLSGRAFLWSDAAGSHPVAIVNREFEKKYFPSGALGHRLFRSGDSHALEIVGVTGGIREMSVAEEPKPELFLALTQAPVPVQSFAILADGGPPGPAFAKLAPVIRREATAVDPHVAIDRLSMMQTSVDTSIAGPRLRRSLLLLFALAAVGLSAIGLYGLIALTVAEQAREIGIRMALGAEVGHARWMTIRRGFGWTSLGLGAGLIGAYVAAKMMESMLYGVQPADPLVYGGTACIFISVTAVASYLPARRITAAQPLKILREA